MAAIKTVENNVETTRTGGVTGAGFVAGVSGNPGGRPKGIARRVRELVGDDGHEIAQFMFDVMSNDKARMADRLDAARWLADRGFGRSVQPVDLDVGQYPALDVKMMSTKDLKTMLEILDRSAPEVAAVAQQSGEIPIRLPRPVEAHACGRRLARRSSTSR